MEIENLNMTIITNENAQVQNAQIERERKEDTGWSHVSMCLCVPYLFAYLVYHTTDT